MDTDTGALGSCAFGLGWVHLDSVGRVEGKRSHLLSLLECRITLGG